MNGRPLRDQKIVFFGAGSSGVGVAETICRWLVLQGIDEQTAKGMFWLVDSKGLVATNRGDKLPSHKQYLARSAANEPRLQSLLDVVKVRFVHAMRNYSEIVIKTHEHCHSTCNLLRY